MDHAALSVYVPRPCSRPHVHRNRGWKIGNRLLRKIPPRRRYLALLGQLQRELKFLDVLDGTFVIA